MRQLLRQVNRISSQQGLITLFKHLQFSPAKNLNADIQIYHSYWRALRLTEWSKIKPAKILRDYLVDKLSTVLFAKMDFFNAQYSYSSTKSFPFVKQSNYFKNFILYYFCILPQTYSGMQMKKNSLQNRLDIDWEEDRKSWISWYAQLQTKCST